MSNIKLCDRCGGSGTEEFYDQHRNKTTKDCTKCLGWGRVREHQWTIEFPLHLDTKANTDYIKSVERIANDIFATKVRLYKKTT